MSERPITIEALTRYLYELANGKVIYTKGDFYHLGKPDDVTGCIISKVAVRYMLDIGMISKKNDSDWLVLSDVAHSVLKYELAYELVFRVSQTVRADRTIGPAIWYDQNKRILETEDEIWRALESNNIYLDRNHMVKQVGNFQS